MHFLKEKPFLKIDYLIGLRVCVFHSANKYFVCFRYAIVVRDNQNLQELWVWGNKKPLRVVKGKLFFHNNPKLCFNKIVQLKDEAKMPDFTDTEVARDSNGDKIACKY
jgi:hypothetical protein